MIRCKKCGNPWALEVNEIGRVECVNAPPHYLGCGKVHYMKRNNTIRKRRTRYSIKKWDHVVFEDKVYEPPLTPHYDEYKGHVFEVVNLHYGRTHVELRCVDDDVVVKGFVHLDELRLADNCMKCLGAKGGVRGNENLIPDGDDYITLCDYCDAELS